MSIRRRRLSGSGAVGLIGERGVLTDLATFTRASSATYFDSSGILQTAVTNEPRFDYLQDGSGYSGLLIEGGRTNICPDQDMTNLTAGAGATVTAAPSEVGVDGVTGNVYRVQMPAAGSTFVQLASGTVQQRTITAYVKKNSETDTDFTLTVGGVVSSRFTATDEWVRYEFEGSSANLASFISNGDDSYASDIFVMFPQVEEGVTFASSYIPTTGSPATRAADVCTIDLSSAPWFNASEGAMFVDAKRYDGFTTASAFVQLDDSTNNNRMRFYQEVSASNLAFAHRVDVSGVNQVALSDSSGNANIRAKAAFAYKVNDFAFNVNDNTVDTDTSGTVPTVDTLRLGTAISAEQNFCHINRLIYYPTRLSNSQLQALTL